MKERPSPLPQRPKNAEHETAIFAAEIGHAAPIDLHGLDTERARAETDAFLDRSFMNGEEVVKIIHGRGELKLKRVVEEILRNHPLVEYFRGSQSPSESNAVTYVRLARKGHTEP
ncbi:Smr/MutS family protein [Candidatus Uhrbacteria bacterium]|nr:Smr/MutS family protein [Candidatus Uhrbacteria bacterium]